MIPRRALCLVAALGLLAAARAAEPDAEVVLAEQTLKDAGVAADGPGLLRFFRERTLSEDERARLTDTVRRLGDDDFDVREKAGADLVRAGRKALPFLKPAVRDKDPERARRAAACVEEIESGKDLLLAASAARLLAERRPDGTAATLLDYLPGIDDDEAVQAAVLRALLAAGVKDGVPDPLLVRALSDREGWRRAGAAHVLGRAVPDQRAAVRRLLADADTRVRYEAAEALLRAGDREAVPALIALVGEGPMPLGWRAQELLYLLGGDKGPSLGLSDEEPAKRAKVADAWRAWWKEAGPTSDLTRVNLGDALRGINVICDEADGGRVWGCRADGKPLWEIKGVMAWDATLLPNGHVLIAEHVTGQVSEREVTGKVLWTAAAGGGGNLTTCKRLHNGNTFVGSFADVREIDPKGTTVYTYKHPNGGLIARAHRLRNGHLLFACGGDRVVEVDEKFAEVRTLKVPPCGDSWISVEPLPGDRFLVAAYGSHKVTELDATGKQVWECAAPTPMSAVRLANGNTLVSSNIPHQVAEYDRAGKEVWKLSLGSGVRCVRRY
jgi:hypothetical protein